MAEALYRTYRPQFFRDVQGQVSIIRTLTQELIQNRIAHAYIFAGTRGTGKTSCARIFAKAINCHAREPLTGEPCGTCSSCLDITTGRSVDVIELDAATHTGVDTVREEIIENARVLPTRDSHKIFIIDEVHMLSTSSFNALLKSLEEPPAHVIYILATTELHKLPATVASRCQRFIFKPLAAEAMEEKLQKIVAAEHMEVEPSVLRRVIAASGGALRDAESLLGQLRAIGNGTITDVEADIVLPPTLLFESIALLGLLNQKNTNAAFAQIQDLFNRGTDLPLFMDALIKHAHEILVVTATKSLPPFLGIFSDEESMALAVAGKNFDASWIANAIEVFLAKKLLYKTIASPFVPLHLACVELTGTKPAPAPVAAPVTPAAPTVQPKPAAPVAAPTANSAVPPPVFEISATMQPSDEALLARVQSVWSTVTQTLAGRVPSMGIFLSATSVVGAAGEMVTLAVHFPMYRAKLLQPTVKGALDAELSAAVGAALITNIIIEELTTPTEGPVADALEMLGGKVVG